MVDKFYVKLKIQLLIYSRSWIFGVVNKKSLCYHLNDIKSGQRSVELFIVLCVSNTSEFQGISAKEFQFDENRIWERDVYDCSNPSLSVY